MGDLRKADYIAKYGEEAWAVEAAKRSNRNKRWREEHPDYNKTPEQRDYKKQYRAEHKEEKREKDRQYYQDNIEERKEYSRQYRQEHAEERAAYKKQYRNTKHGRAKNLVACNNDKDLKRGYDISRNVDAKWIEKFIFSGQVCIYCGESDWRKLGADRIDNAKPHTSDNLVCACGKCNNKRRDYFTMEEFLKIKKGGA